MLFDWRELVERTFRDPRSAAQSLMALNLPMPVIWMAFAAVTAATSALQGVNTLIMPAPDGFPSFFSMPVLYAIVMAASTLAFVVLAIAIGRVQGGQGRFEDLFLLMIWLQGLYAALQAATLVLLLVFAVFGALASVLAMIWALWLSVVLIDEAHGFGSMGKSILTLIMTVVASLILLVILLPILGLAPAG